MAAVIYSNCSTLTLGCILYTNSALTSIVANGYYSDGTNCYTVNSGAITYVGTCGTTTSSTTSTSTTSTSTSSTTSTTTFSPNPCICTEVVVTSAGAEVETFNCYGVNENYVYMSAGTYYLCAAEIGGLLQAFFISGTGTISSVGNCKTGTCPPATTSTSTSTSTTTSTTLCPCQTGVTIDVTLPGYISGTDCYGNGFNDYIGGGTYVYTNCIQGTTLGSIDAEFTITSYGTCCTTTTSTSTTSTSTTSTTTLTPCVDCGINQYGGWSPSEYHQYPTASICASVSSSVNLDYDAYDRPNRFTVYDSIGYITSSGWVGTAAYPGPWGSSLSTSPTGNIPFVFGSTSGRYMLVEAGNADPILPISDSYTWVLVCNTPTTTTSTTSTTTTTTTPPTYYEIQLCSGGSTYIMNKTDGVTVVIGGVYKVYAPTFIGTMDGINCWTVVSIQSSGLDDNAVFGTDYGNCTACIGTTTTTSTSTTTTTTASDTLFYISNSSLDIIITDVKVNGVSLTGATGAGFPVYSGDSINAYSNQLGTQDVVIYYSNAITGQHIEGYDSDLNFYCNATVGIGSHNTTFAGASVGSGTFQIYALDGAC